MLLLLFVDGAGSVMRYRPRPPFRDVVRSTPQAARHLDEAGTSCSTRGRSEGGVAPYVVMVASLHLGPVGEWAAGKVTWFGDRDDRGSLLPSMMDSIPASGYSGYHLASLLIQIN